MGWFEEQIETRKKRDSKILSDSYQNIASSITGRRRMGGEIDEDLAVKDALEALTAYFRIKDVKLPETISDIEGKLDHILSPYGIMYREVNLEKGWHRDACGPMLASMKEENTVVALIPGHFGGYTFLNPLTGKNQKVTASLEKLIDGRAYLFYKPMPMQSMNAGDLFRYMISTLTAWDIVSFLLAAALITLVGLLIPVLNHILTGNVVEYESYSLLYGVAIFLLTLTVTTLMLTAIKELLVTRIRTKVSVNVQAASMMRILSLPASFFKDYSSGELSEYLNYMNSLSEIMIDALFSIGVTGLFSLIYLTQIFHYAASLVVPSLLILVLSLIISILGGLLQAQISKRNMAITAKESGFVFSLITGIQKIRLSGAEKRAMAKWSELYAQEAKNTYNPPMLIKINNCLVGAFSLIGMAFIYYIAVKSKVSVADYYGFYTAYGYVSTAFGSVAAVVLTVATIRPILDTVKPLMEAEPEVMKQRETISRVSGEIEFSHIYFRYSDDGPWILNDLSIKIPARQYVAIVGKTGCGKSTLMRLLLGFEAPVRGSIFYDNKDMRRLDIKSLRKKMGIVLQDGKIFGGSIFENITISMAEPSLEAAWEAAEIAGMAEDIRSMPMGMNTMLQEGAGGISGGQRQRIMIARAIAPKPKILMLDEATSALDNITQKNVSESLDRMKCTRIVIAHRLSTIRHCDRILVLDGGKIVEEGNYDELIAKGGFFAELVARQRIEE